MQITELPAVLAAHIAAVNAHDTDAVMATFAPDALVNDARREYLGTDAVRDWIDREIVGDNVSYELVEAFDQHGETVFRVMTDGDYDKTNLPDPLILTAYAGVGEAGIEHLIIILNRGPGV